MKDSTKLKSNVYCGASVDAVSRNMINRQMFHHYRRVLSARKVVDSSSPPVYGRRGAGGTPRSSGGGGSGGNEGGRCIVAEMLTLSSCGTGGGRRSALDVRRSPVCATPQNKKKGCGCHGTDRKSATFSCPDVAGGRLPRPSTVPRREAQSKVRGLRVYHPPRKRSKQRAAQVEPVVTSGESSARSTGAWASADDPAAAAAAAAAVGVCFCGVAKAKVVSSCDSAYNGGGTSSAAESAASSPARRQHQDDTAATTPRESAFRQFVDVACQTEDAAGGDTSVSVQTSLHAGRGTTQEQQAGGTVETPESVGWSLTELFLYPDPFDDDLLLEECLKDMQGLSLVDMVPPSLSAPATELFV